MKAMAVSSINSTSSVNNIYEANAKLKQAEDSSFEKRLVKAMDEKDKEELKEVCQEFESIMLNMMFKEMRATVMKSDLIPEDAGTEIFQSMLDEQYVEKASESGGIGLGDMLYKQLSKKLESVYKLE